MIAVYILLGILGVLLLLLCLPAGVHLRYSAAGMALKLVYGPIRLRLLPSKGKKKKKKEKKPKEKPAPKEPEPVKNATEAPKKGGNLKDLMEYVPIGLDLLNAIRRRLLMRKLVLLVNLAGNDPCDLALLYGKANAGVACALPLLERCFRIRHRDVQRFYGGFHGGLRGTGNCGLSGQTAGGAAALWLEAAENLFETKIKEGGAIT